MEGAGPLRLIRASFVAGPRHLPSTKWAVHRDAPQCGEVIDIVRIRTWQGWLCPAGRSRAS
jgi:hypothetical protein